VLGETDSSIPRPDVAGAIRASSLSKADPAPFGNASAAPCIEEVLVVIKRGECMKASVLFVSALFLSAPAAAQGINDAQIASIAVTANQVDVDAGKLAASTSKNAEVKKFAQLMVTDHTAVNQQAVDLVTRLKVTPEDNDTSRSLKAGGEKNVAALKALKGAAFDKAYVDHEVAYHQAVLDAVDQTLIPNAKNAELKALLVKVRPAFVAHLEHAKHIASSLGTK
jgi:putative membrane protein